MTGKFQRISCPKGPERRLLPAGTKDATLLVTQPPEEIIMSHRLKTGDRVTWNTPQGMTTGTVVRRIIRDTELDGHTFTASKEDPRYEVESEKSGEHAVHRAEGLEKVHKH
jgi:Hypervirulence associated proteins TUDOR domain